MAITQDNRSLNITTPLGKDVLLLSSFTAEEEMSRLFKVTAEVLHEESPGGEEVYEIDPLNLLGHNAAIKVTQRDGTTRKFAGIVNRFEQRNRDDRFTYYQLEIVPQVWLLSQIRRSRIFQNISVPDILREVLSGLNVDFRLQSNYEQRNYCVQYRETDLDFVLRLMEEEGIFFYFNHETEPSKMVIGDSANCHDDCPSKNQVTFVLRQTDEDDFLPIVREWLVNYRLQTGKVTLWDHNFQLPYNRLDAQQPTRFAVGKNQSLEIYDYPGGYARKFDGIDTGGGPKPDDLQKVFRDKARMAALAMESLDSRYKTISGVGDLSSMTPGYTFTLQNHPIKKYNAKYVLTSVSHSATQSPDYESDNEVSVPYDNGFTCIPVGSSAPCFRPERVTPRPVVDGPQTAVVVGPAGEEIFTDEYGRVKVQFHWDRDSRGDAGSSCWIRVAQNWSGKKWGVMFIPRIGMEVIVDFIEGDPDRPIITGCVYNADTMPPYTLPDEKTKSTIKSNSSKGGGGFNEFRFEDKKGEEQIFIHAEKDMDVRVNHDKKEIILNERHTIVESNSYEVGRADSHSELTGNYNHQVGGSMSVECKGDIDTKIGGKNAVDAGQEIHLKAGMKIIIEAGMQISLKASGSFIDIGPGGVSISGPMVNINSGGSPGSGSGCATTAPTAPKEAGTAEAGEKGKKPPEGPGQGATGAAGMCGAAASGAPFVSPPGSQDAGMCLPDGSSGSAGSAGGGSSSGGSGGSGGESGVPAEAGHSGGYSGGMAGEDAKIGGGTGGFGAGNSDAAGQSGSPSSGTGAASGQKGDHTDQEALLGGDPNKPAAGESGSQQGKSSSTDEPGPGDPDEPVPATGGF